MRSSGSRLAALSSTLVLLCLHSGMAYAYIDPNAGGMLFQLLAPLFAAVVGGWLFLRRWITEQLRRLWRRITCRSAE